MEPNKRLEPVSFFVAALRGESNCRSTGIRFPPDSVVRVVELYSDTGFVQVAFFVYAQVIFKRWLKLPFERWGGSA